MIDTSSLARRAGVKALLVCACAAACGTGAGASGHAVAVARFQAAIGPRTSLRVSAQVLFLDPRPPGADGPAGVGSIDFRAAARTTGAGEVVLTVEPLAPLPSLGGGPSGAPAVISFTGSGAGAQDGVLRDGQPETAARWAGSGLHTGRLTFVATGSIASQGVSVPLRFLLTAP